MRNDDVSIHCSNVSGSSIIMSNNKCNINGKTINIPDGANVSVKNGKVYINGKLQDDLKDNVIKLFIEGNAGNIVTDCLVKCNNVKGDVKAGSYVECDNITGNVEAKNYIECNDIGGDAKAGGYIEAKCIKGSVEAGGYVEYNRK